MAIEQETQPTRRKTGLIVLGAAATLAVIAGLFAGAFGLGLLSHRLTVTSYFAQSAGLKSGAAVNLDGVAIGTVKSVTITNAPDRKKTPVQVVMRLNRKYLPNLHTDSLATLTSLGALADTSIDIDSMKATGPPPKDGDELKTLATPMVVDLKAGQAIVRSLNALEVRANALVDEAVTGKGSTGQFFSNPSLQNEAAATYERVRDVSSKLDGNKSTAGKLLNDHSIADKFASISKNTQSLQASFTKLSGGPLQANIATTQAHVNSLMADVNAGKGGVGMVLNDPATSAQMKDTMAKANALVSNYNKNPATGGNFAAGGATTLSLAKLQAESSELATMIRQNPRKYLTIKIRLF